MMMSISFCFPKGITFCASSKDFTSVSCMKSRRKSLGFSDANYFSNVFRATVGVSPREYRKRSGKKEKSSGKDISGG